MDSDLEELDNLLRDIKLPSSIRDLRNPTEEFVMGLIETFLKLFKIDVDVINKPTFEQQLAISSTEDTDIVSIINLYVAIKQICDRIFIKSFCLSDITSGGSKRICRVAKYLANFIVYVSNKELDIQGLINKIHSKVKQLEELNEKNQNIQTLINEKNVNTSRQLALKEKYKMEIEQLRSVLDNNETSKLEIQEEMLSIEEERKKLLEEYNAHKVETNRLDKTIAELKLEVVTSPEEYSTRLCDLEQQHEEKIEERKMLEKTFLTKKELEKKYENLLSLVQKQYEMISEIKDIHECLQKNIIQGESLQKQVDTMEIHITELNKKHKDQEDNQGSTIDEILTQTKERLNAVRELQAQLLSKKQVTLSELENKKRVYNDVDMEIKTFQDLIKKVEEETTTFIKNCQELYNHEIRNEINLRKHFDSVWDSSNSTNKCI
ncbi:PREDICTED: probable kinetochore protein nuf2 [Polistes canadensis]|uniref:probable kinetochore protein nuf2 n=1 Tax=Polistes canadensis TaxID=91411 RepID=UPI000718E172|nr:PREDICTED: probable kinetochore protein nuf2 [Polistes canadensis]